MSDIDDAIGMLQTLKEIQEREEQEPGSTDREVEQAFERGQELIRMHNVDGEEWHMDVHDRKALGVTYFFADHAGGFMRGSFTLDMILETAYIMGEKNTRLALLQDATVAEEAE